MMNPSRQFRHLIFLLVLLSIVSFCLAERNMVMLLVAVPATALAWLLTEGPRSRPLPGWAVNLGALGVLTWLAFSVFGPDGERDGNMVLAAGHFTLWLQIVVLYRKKANREYGQLLVLTAVQMVAASVVNISLLYGVMLMLYCALALVTVLLFQLKTSIDRVEAANRAAAAVENTAEAPATVAGPGHRWQFRGITTLIGTMCVMIAMLVFIAMPRSPASASGGLGARASEQIDFTDTVQLNGSSSQKGSNRQVMVVRLMEDGQVVGGPEQSLLLRGAVARSLQ